MNLRFELDLAFFSSSSPCAYSSFSVTRHPRSLASLLWRIRYSGMDLQPASDLSKAAPGSILKPLHLHLLLRQSRQNHRKQICSVFKPQNILQQGRKGLYQRVYIHYNVSLTISYPPLFEHHTVLLQYQSKDSTMGTGSKVVSVILRIGELICGAIVVGIIGRFIYLLGVAGETPGTKILYTEAVAAIGIVAAILLIVPLIYSFYAFPLDLILSIMWFVAFGLMVNVSFAPFVLRTKRLTSIAHWYKHLHFELVLQLLGILLGLWL
jgi:hypothetical protein